MTLRPHITGFLSGLAALALLLLSLQVIPSPCDDSCNTEEQSCECACLCCDKNLSPPPNHAIPFMIVAPHAIAFDAIQRHLLQIADIFRPPIA